VPLWLLVVSSTSSQSACKCFATASFKLNSLIDLQVQCHHWVIRHSIWSQYELALLFFVLTNANNVMQQLPLSSVRSTPCPRTFPLDLDPTTILISKSRVPNPSTGVSLRLLPVLLSRTRTLYVDPSRFLPSCSWESRRLTSMVVYIFVGSILLDVHTLDIVFGSIIGIIGLAYAVLEFVPSIEPPQNMRYVGPFLPRTPTKQANLSFFFVQQRSRRRLGRRTSLVNPCLISTPRHPAKNPVLSSPKDLPSESPRRTTSFSTLLSPLESSCAS